MQDDDDKDLELVYECELRYDPRLIALVIFLLGLVIGAGSHWLLT